MKFFSYLFFCFLLFLHQSFIFTQVAKGHEDWSAIEIQRFSETLEAVGVARESILSLIAATDYQEIQRITSFLKHFISPTDSN